MATRRNNMFYARGAASSYSAIISILKEFKSDNERIEIFEKLRSMWLKQAKDHANGMSDFNIESITVFTNKYYVTVKDGRYELVDDKINGESFDGIIFWNKYTNTNYIIELTGDWDSVADFTDNDENFTDNMAKLIGCSPDELEIVNKPYTVYVEPCCGESIFDYD